MKRLGSQPQALSAARKNLPKTRPVVFGDHFLTGIINGS